jgi:hypothetical protein
LRAKSAVTAAHAAPSASAPRRRGLKRAPAGGGAAWAGARAVKGLVRISMDS